MIDKLIALYSQIGLVDDTYQRDVDEIEDIANSYFKKIYDDKMTIEEVFHFYFCLSRFSFCRFQFNMLVDGSSFESSNKSSFFFFFFFF